LRKTRNIERPTALVVSCDVVARVKIRETQIEETQPILSVSGNRISNEQVNRRVAVHRDAIPASTDGSS